MEYEEKRDVIRELLNILKKNNISQNYKKIIYNIVTNLPEKTAIQKDRFIKLFWLNPKAKEKYTLTLLAKEYHCSNNAIRVSIITVKSALTRISDEDIKILKKIIEIYK